ncbi:hypothetical protein NLJ89_g9538 [Agrocybe chaxingu]|uniref:Uncharacterized protein n=1 Tax=Agrocybe chaxingu TaxID=84603 RepID=A0A9W8MR47_9AGAR|nr:hypothetical protein NLJ89_g9538 [Agrocybe chaxingu]
MSKVQQLDGEFPIVKGCPPTAKLPPNPHLVDTLRAGPTSPSTSESGTFFDLHPLTRDEKAFRNALLWVDQFCFLTGSASADLEPCYVVHPVRGSDEANVDRRKEVEDLLSDAGFNYGDKFRFDALFNGILLEASLHCQWATYASFCFVPPSARRTRPA